MSEWMDCRNCGTRTKAGSARLCLNCYRIWEEGGDWGLETGASEMKANIVAWLRSSEWLPKCSPNNPHFVEVTICDLIESGAVDRWLAEEGGGNG